MAQSTIIQAVDSTHRFRAKRIPWKWSIICNRANKISFMEVCILTVLRRHNKPPPITKGIPVQNICRIRATITQHRSASLSWWIKIKASIRNSRRQDHFLCSRLHWQCRERSKLRQKTSVLMIRRYQIVDVTQIAVRAKDKLACKTLTTNWWVCVK